MRWSANLASDSNFALAKFFSETWVPSRPTFAGQVIFIIIPTNYVVAPICDITAILLYPFGQGYSSSVTVQQVPEKILHDIYFLCDVKTYTYTSVDDLIGNIFARHYTYFIFLDSFVYWFIQGSHGSIINHSQNFSVHDNKFWGEDVLGTVYLITFITFSFIAKV